MKYFMFFLILFFSYSQKAIGQEYFFKQYSNEEGLNHSFIYSINQDEYGFLWIGTGEGLYRTNGFEIEYFSTEDGLADNFITKIFKEKNGRLWIGHQSGAISILNKNGFDILNETAEVHGSVTDIAEDDLGLIWLTIQNQGLLYLTEDNHITQVSFPVNEGPLTQIEALANGHFLIGSQDNIYFTKYDKSTESMILLKKIDDYPGSKVVEILKQSTGNYIVVSQGEGLCFLKFDINLTDFEFSPIDDNSDGILDNIQGGIIDGTGNIWLSSMGSGIIKYREHGPGKFSRMAIMSTENGLVSDDVRTVFEDMEGNIWFGLYGQGLLRYFDNNIKFYRYGREDGANKIYTISGDNSSLLLVNDDSLLRINQTGDSILNSYALPYMKSSDKVNSVFMADDGRLWLGCEQSGLYVSGVSNFSFKPVNISTDNLSNSINHITGKGAYIWVATKKGICRITRETDSTKWFTLTEGLPHNNINHLFIDSNDRVLISTLCNNIFYIKDNEEVVSLIENGFGPPNTLVSITEAKDGSLWVITSGNGVLQIAEEGNVNYNRKSGLLSDFCYSLGQTLDGLIVIGHRGGISQFDPATHRMKTFGQADGIKSSTEFYPNAIFNNQFGDLWFGTSEGLVVYSSTISAAGMMPPLLQIEALYIDGEKTDISSEIIVLKPGHYELEVEYVGINFTNSEGVLYQTKLEGYNNKWSDPSFARKTHYDNIDHGNYTFQLKAINENNVGSELSSGFELKIMKPVYLTVWFYVILAVIIALVFYGIIRNRERMHRVEQERLLMRIDEKTKDIIVKEEIIKERKKIEVELREAKDKAELSDKLKTSFLLNMSHEIRTPLNAIFGFAQLVDAEGIEAEARSNYLSIISQNSQSLLVMIDDILDLSSLETNQLKLNMRSYKLKSIIKELKLKGLEILKNEGKNEINLISKFPEDDDLSFVTDRERLQQVLLKLIDNAIKYTESGKVTFGYELNKKDITFFVEDTGIGLSEDKKRIIFDLFRKVEDDKLKLYRGIGIGLTLSMSIVNLLGGKIDVESEENVGSRFYFSLPIDSND